MPVFFSRCSLSLSTSVACFVSVMNLDWFYTTLNSIEGLYFYCCFYGTSAGARVYAYRWLAHQRFMCTRFVQVIDPRYTKTIFVVSFTFFFLFRFIREEKSLAKATEWHDNGFEHQFCKDSTEIKRMRWIISDFGSKEVKNAFEIPNFLTKIRFFVTFNCMLSMKKRILLLKRSISRRKIGFFHSY